jgi:multiple sugar transport system permease protein
VTATALDTLDARATTKVASRAQTGSDSRTRFFNALCGTVAVLFALIWLVPLLWAVVTSLRPESEITTHPSSWWTGHWTFDGYRQVIDSSDILVWYMNSFITAALSALLSVVTCSMAGFALARTRFAGRRIVLGLLLAGLVIPPQVLIIPMFQEFTALHLTNTYWSLILPTIPNVIAVFVFMTFFRGIPTSLAEAARCDGASWFRLYRSVYLPLSRPAISAVAILTFVWTWNNFLWPLLVLSSTKTMTIPVGLASVASGYGAHYAEVMASAVLGALPLFAVFVLFQRQIIEGVTSTGLKG